MTGAFHEGLREAMGEPANPMVQHIRELHAAKVLTEQQEADARVLAEHEGRIYEMVIFTADESQMEILKSVANDLEAHGDEPYVRWTRDHNGEIIGMSLWARLSTETLAGMGEVPFASLRATARRVGGGR